MKKIKLLFLLLIITGSLLAQSTITKGLVAYYPFNGNGNDASVNNNNLTNAGAIPTIDKDGIASGAMLFSGAQYMIGNNKALPSKGSARTISFWVNNGTKHSDNSGQTYFSYGPQKLNEGFQIFSRGTRQGSANIIRVSPIGQDLDHNYTYQENTWIHLLATYENKKVKLWIDGQLVDSAIATNPWNTTLDSIVIGRNDLRHSFAGFFNGALDELRIYNRVLSNKEIEGLFTGCLDTTLTINDSINSGDSVLIGGVYQTAAGTYTDSLKSKAGCDSIIVTNLFVKPNTKTQVRLIESNLRISVFPNPTTGIVSLKGLDSGEKQNIKVINVTGEVIYRQENSGESEVAIDLSEQRSGIYFISINSNTSNYSQQIILEK